MKPGQISPSRAKAATRRSFGLITIGTNKTLYLATDDGIWTITEGITSAQPFALNNELINSLSEGSTATELVGVAHHSAIFRFDVAQPKVISWIDLDEVAVTGLPETVTLNRFVLRPSRGQRLS